MVQAKRYRIVIGLVSSLPFIGLLACSDDLPPWPEQTREERERFMRERVVPELQPRFQRFDPVKYERFGCETCHGKDAASRRYRMPNPELEPLPLEGTLAYARSKDAKATQFMLDSVHPIMAELLGEARYNEVTAPDGFRCTRCHPVLP